MMIFWAGGLFLAGGITGQNRFWLPKIWMVDVNVNLSVDPLFEESVKKMGFSTKAQSAIRSKIEDVGFESISELMLLARDFTDRPEVFSDLLQSDFGFDALVAHRTRAVIMEMIDKDSLQGTSKEPSIALEIKNVARNNCFEASAAQGPLASTTNIENLTSDPTAVNYHHVMGDDVIKSDENEEPKLKKLVYKKVVVNEQAHRRRKKAVLEGNQHDYGLPSNYNEMFPLLETELGDFYSFMTRPFTASQEEHIRPATANVYLRHAKLFLGWYVNQHSCTASNSLSLFTIIPNKEKESADTVLEFVLWLRSSRGISVSYEANLLRGITKLIKFRFARESKADPTYGDKAFDDIPMIREIRKLHRDANKRQSMAPRSSDEDRKWLSWPDYLQVVLSIKRGLLDFLDDYGDATPQPNEGMYSSTERKIATAYQYYLILAFFANVPDRQRTIRELELGRSFIKDVKQDVWTIKHAPDDYKTGKTYGDRPALSLAPGLVPAIDDFIVRWRQCLRPSTDALFVQPRTGNPLTQDSVYQIVARNCYKCTGKRTNPHLLRDMIVTHVKESDASEKELEALALFMGHSVSMQRNSYDRRTLTKKVAPAVELIHNINKLGEDNYLIQPVNIVTT
jgi:hypothetical protein